MTRTQAYAKKLLGEGDARAAQYYAEFEKNPRLSAFIKDLEALGEILRSGKSTIIFDWKTEPFTPLGPNIAAPIIYTSVNQTSVVVPFEIAGRPTVNITVRRAGQTSVALNVRVVDFAPGLFTTNQQGTGQGAIINQNGTVNAITNPAAKGSVVAIYLTGAGLISTNPATGSVVGGNPLPVINAPVTVTIGGVNARVEYKGAAPQAIAGLYQFNVTVPLDAPSGVQPVSVNVGGVPAQTGVTLAIQ